MATALDVFELLYTQGTTCSPQEVLHLLHKPAAEYSCLYQTLLRLQTENLIQKTPAGFQVILSARSELLYRLIRFCLANDLKYNDLLERNVASFIRKAWVLKQFSAADFALNPRTLTRYVNLLDQSGFLIILSRKPLLALLLRHSFLHKVCEYFGRALPRAPFLTREELWPRLQRELRFFHRLRKKNERKYAALTENYQLRFIQHSLNLEGNPITLPQTVKLLQQQIVPAMMSLEAMEEVRNYQRAMEAMLKDVTGGKPLTLQSILNYHYLALRHKPEIAGQIRNVSVFIKNNPGFKISTPERIQEKVEVLLQRYNAFIARKKHSLREVFHFAAQFHNEFQHIHPFIDGNSRTTRLITFHLLRSVGLPIIDIPLGLLEEYLSSTKGALKRNDQRLKKVLELAIFYNVRLFTEQLK